MSRGRSKSRQANVRRSAGETLGFFQGDLSVFFVALEASFDKSSLRSSISVRSYSLPPNPMETIRTGKEQFADAEIIVGGAKLIVQATVEQQAEIAAWLKPGGQKSVKPATNKTEKLLGERRFTLKLDNAALGDVIKTFVANGVQIKYDPMQFADADISLDKKIDKIDVKQVPAEKLFRDLFEPLGIAVSIDGETVTLRPK